MISLNFTSLDLIALLVVLVAAHAQELQDDILLENNVQAAQFMQMGGMSGMGGMNPMMMNRNQYPVDYSEFLIKPNDVEIN